MRGNKILTTLALSALLFAGCGVKNSETAITVNGAAITKGDIDEAINAQIKNSPFTKMGIDIKNSQNDFLYLLTKDRVVNELIIKSLINEECNKRDITVSKDEQELAMEDLISKIGSKERFNEFLKQRGISKEQFNKDFNQELRIKKLAMQLDNTQVTEADAKKYYNSNIKKFKFPDKVRASHILISTNPYEIEQHIRADKANKKLTDDEIKGKVQDELAARKVKAEELLKTVQADKTQFAKLAKENSEDKGSAEQGGDLGFFAAVEMVPEFSGASFATKPGNIYNKVVQSKFGYHIIYVTDRSAAGQYPFEAVQYEITNYLQAQKEVKAIDNLIEAMKKNAQIEYLDKEYDPAGIKEGIQKEMNSNEPIIAPPAEQKK
ncbi:MAG: peptidylprolyl isomerase [Fusobacterium sp.]|nr:peptidylprolyl isomerase [Fusobacterium sp.]